ncbi:MAG: prepilin-type N-terminal cleavage/methylation domain-containing protein [Polyangiaceae bacterium]|jgi:general secretion pathway protein I
MGKPRAFSLLEVMVAVAILGLTLTVIISAQGGLAASNKMAANMGLASTLGRCKMTEMEEKLLKLGYPLIEDIQSGVYCCNDRDDGVFTCDTRVEKVTLPNPPDNSLGDGGSSLALSSLASAATASPSAGAGGLAALGGAIAPGLGANAAGGAGLDFDGGLQGLGAGIMSQFGAGGQAGGQGVQGLLQMVMGMVYPSLKLMFEASIRRLTVTVRWSEGPNPKEFTLVQYVTNPQQAGFTAGAVPSAGASGGAATLAPPTGPGGLPLGGSFLPQQSGSRF